ncbi:hypothetical protein GF342_04480 [Candidatus Woesearchaeota archaeon]|nr:hypothetical protein [Candidatus Woesearchaeota archaeon]
MAKDASRSLLMVLAVLLLLLSVVGTWLALTSEPHDIGTDSDTATISLTIEKNDNPMASGNVELTILKGGNV